MMAEPDTRGGRKAESTLAQLSQSVGNMAKLVDFSEYKGATSTGEEGWRGQIEVLVWVTRCPFCSIGLAGAFYSDNPSDFPAPQRA